MNPPRPFALIRTTDQWSRASFENAALLGEVAVLAWRTESPESPTDDGKPIAVPDGLAFDAHCRLFHGIAAENRVERLLWAAQTEGPVDLFAPPTAPATVSGSFVILDGPSLVPVQPCGLAVDSDERLFIAERGAQRMLIYDLFSKRLLRAVPLSATPVDLVADGRSVLVLLAAPAGLARLSAHGDPEPLPWPSSLTEPSRMALAPDRLLYVLEQAGTAAARVHQVDFSGLATETESVPFATDIEFQAVDERLREQGVAEGQVLVVARRARDDFARYVVGSPSKPELPPLKARGYGSRGFGIVRTPDNSIGFFTDAGFRQAVPARVRYQPEGSVTTFRLDSGEFQTVWGRVFLDACIPRETRITLRCVTADEPPGGPEMPRVRPANARAEFDQRLSAPMPPDAFDHDLRLLEPQALHRRDTGRELPWLRAGEGDPFETYEAPIIAGPGRYLWIRIGLSGNTRTSPRFRALRAEYPSHDYLRRIPRTFSRDQQVAAFLRRYLAIFEGVLGELEAKADTRAVLLNPRSAPAEILPWLAAFVGLAFDERMAHAPRRGGQIQDVRRELIAEAVVLFRFRGTVWGLRRFLHIYLGVEPILIEKFRLRGAGGPTLGDASGPVSNSVLGAGFRVGGAIGEEESNLIDGSIDDAFRTHAHRFAVIIPDVVNEEQLEVVHQILEVHRPAHTLVEVCTSGAGMRVGSGLHLELTSIVGPTGGFRTLRPGNSFLGRDTIVGRPVPGGQAGTARLGTDSQVG